MTQLLTLGASFPVSWSVGQLVLKFHWVKTYRQCWHTNYIEITISHAQTNLLFNCAGGSQGVKLLDWSNKGQVWTIRLRQVWGSWHPSIQCWSLWIGKSTCSCKPTLPETEPATSNGIIQAHVLQALKTLFRSKLQAGSLVRVWRMKLCSHRYVRITELLSAPLVLRIGDWLCIFLQSPL